ncbi:MAG: hypothetical protein DBW85_01115 [Synechococcus sp. MED-G71]|nr:MAG: hypothetical protein DBW85_01115 [Synechococcus sp. MED-G71]RPF77730.1 MAG: hypothetical protein CBD15_001990 [Synechococcus sp. TMED155]|tara:strand:+ start:1652 stop:2161 length:510 start_codon:yes stop_codon:yes gene_type:complete
MLPFLLGEPQELPDPPLPIELAKKVAETEEPRLELTPTDARDRQGNRIWDLELRQGSELIRRWSSVTGRPYTEERDRFSRPGNHAPLPPGPYRIGAPIRLHSGDLYELGRSWFIPVDPLFATPRSHFGIHEDVSRDGTAGCIGLAGRRLTEEVTRWVRSAGARYLLVKG